MKKRAFTLVELLAVISIITLLMALLLAALGRARAQARMVVCQSSLRQWGLYFNVYTEENNHRFFGQVKIGAGYPDWREPMRVYFEAEPEILLCPSARKHRRLPGVTPIWGGGSRSAWKHAGIVGSYGTNHWIATPEPGRGSAAQQSRCWETPLVRTAARVPVFLGCMFGGGGPSRYNGPPIRDDVHLVTGGGCNMAHFCVNRHHGHVNSLFMDWSVRKVGLKELWALKWHRQYDTSGAWTKAGGALREDWPQWLRGFREC